MLKVLPHQEARRVFEIEADAIRSLVNRVDETFDSIVDAILVSAGRVVVSGIGKSGIVARKIAATLASTGTPSLFLHPTEAFHGDLGVVDTSDVFLALSNSGETEELVRLMPFLRNNDNVVIAITGNPDSHLARSADFQLNAGVAKEACPLKLAPTASTTASLAMGDALAIALMRERGFEPESFARLHPGGSLGRRLLSKVADEMVRENLPVVSLGSDALEVIKVISDGALGLAVVYNNERQLKGVVTDGDVRRAIEGNGMQFFDMTAEKMMTPNPLTTSPHVPIHDAIELMHAHRITALLVRQESVIIGVLKK